MPIIPIIFGYIIYKKLNIIIMKKFIQNKLGPHYEAQIILFGIGFILSLIAIGLDYFGIINLNH